MEPVGIGIVVASFLNGLRHGFDVDHIAAIGDLVSAQTERRRSLFLASVYAAGHAAIVVVLGVAAIVAGANIPPAIDAFMSKVVGASLVLLGLYVLYSFGRYRSHARLRSRWQLATAALHRLRHLRQREEVVIEHAHEHSHDELHRHEHPAQGTVTQGSIAVAVETHVHTHRHVGVMPTDPLPAYGSTAAFGVGVLHGMGAETPTQILLFLTAAGVGSLAAGMSVLAVFVAGLLISNGAIAIAIALSFGASSRSKANLVYPALALATALFSLAVGVSYLRV